MELVEFMIARDQNARRRRGVAGEMTVARRMEDWSPEPAGVHEPRQDPPHNLYERGYLRIDFDAYLVWREGRPVHLTRREFELLRFFVGRANRVVSRKEILTQLWPRGRVRPRTVDVHVFRLRHCLEREPEHPELFVTVRGVGVRFDERPLLEAEATDARSGNPRHRSSHHGSR